MGKNLHHFKIGAIRGAGFLSVVLLGSLVSLLFAQSLHTFQTAQVVSAQQINDNFTNLDTATKLNVPDGFIGVFNLATCPSGWLVADGTNGTPDLRGAFVRGLDDFGTGAAGRDPSGVRALANYQADAFQGHYHNNYNFDGGAPGVGAARFYQVAAWRIGGQWVDNVRGPRNGAHGPIRVTTETRPKNVALLYCQRKR